MKVCAIANIIEYDEAGRTTRKPARVNLRLCTSNEPQVFEISLPDKRVTRHRSIVITRAEVERVLKANPIRRRRS